MTARPRRRESAAAWLRRVGDTPAPRLGEAFTGGVLGGSPMQDLPVPGGVGFVRNRKPRGHQ